MCDANKSIADRLEQYGEDFDFFQAIRLLQNACHDEKQQSKVSFDNALSFSFSASSVCRIRKINASYWNITAGKLGLYGPHGVLPPIFLETILNNKRARCETGNKQFPLKDFLDIFNNRLLLLHYFVWKKYKFYIFYEEQQKNKNNFETILLSYLGIKNHEYVRNFFCNSVGLFCFTKLFMSRGCPTASHLKQLLSVYFNLPIKITEDINKQVILPISECTLLSSKKRDFSLLGHGALLGTSLCYGRQHIRITIGPVSYAKYIDLLPGTSTFKKMREIIKFYLGITYSYDLQFLLADEEMPGLYLATAAPPQLGWCTWLPSKMKKMINVVIEATN